MKRNEIRLSNMREAVSKTVRLLAKNSIKVTQRGADAYCAFDPKGNVILINLPVIPDSPTPAFMNALQGFLDHEVAHALFTNGTAYHPAILKAKGEKHNKDLHNIANIVEDVRIEIAMAERFAGSEVNMNSTREFMVEGCWEDWMKKIDAMAISDTAKDVMRRGVAFVPFIRARGGQKVCGDFITKHGLWDQFKDIDTAVPDLAQRLTSLKSTEEALELAKVLKDYINNDDANEDEGDGEDDKSKKGKQKGKPDKDAEDEEGEGASSGDDDADEEDEGEDQNGGSSEGDEGDEGEEDNEEGSESGADGDEEDDDDESQEGDGDGADGDGSDDPSEGEEGEKAEKNGAAPPSSPSTKIDLDLAKDADEALGEALKGMMKGGFARDIQTDWTRDFDIVEKYKVKGEVDVPKMEDRVRQVVGGLQSELQRLVVARSQSYYTPGFRSGRLHAPGLHRLTAGDDRIFRRRHVAETKDVAVTLLVDLSGSMRGTKVQTALISAWAFSEVLDRIGVKNEVCGFTNADFPKDCNLATMQAEVEKFAQQTGLREGCIRYAPLWMPIFKDFDERFGPETKKRLADQYKNQRGMHSNNDALAVEVAGTRLSQRREPRKIMLVLSDGLPADYGLDDKVLNNSLKTQIERLENNGVEVIGIGIEDSSVKKFYKKNAVIRNASELPRFVTKELKALLVG